MRYYVRVAPFLLPVVEDRPLIMKRFPNGIDGQAFYQQRAPDRVPPGVRTATMPGDVEVPSRVIGGNLITLLYLTQLAAISQDPWFSRVAVAGDRRPLRNRSRPDARSEVRCGAGRRPLGARRAGQAQSGWISKDVRSERPPHLHSSSRGNAVRSGPDFLPDRRHRRGRETSEDRHDHAVGAGPRAEGVRGLPAEYRGEISRVRVQRARKRLRRRVHAADVEGDRRRASTRATLRSGHSPTAWPRSATSGRLCSHRKASICGRLQPRFPQAYRLRSPLAHRV